MSIIPLQIVGDLASTIIGAKATPFHCLCVNFVGKKGHTAKTCYKIPGNSPKSSMPTVNLAQTHTPHEPAWLVDSGASHHITNDMSKLQVKDDYNGPDHLMVAN
ncbi:hypothetical protein SESBI_50194, partial [Sesbania bispinosa]